MAFLLRWTEAWLRPTCPCAHGYLKRVLFSPVLPVSLHLETARVKIAPVHLTETQFVLVFWFKFLFPVTLDCQCLVKNLRRRGLEDDAPLLLCFTKAISNDGAYHADPNAEGTNSTESLFWQIICNTALIDIKLILAHDIVRSGVFYRSQCLFYRSTYQCIILSTWSTWIQGFVWSFVVLWNSICMDWLSDCGQV